MPSLELSNLDDKERELWLLRLCSGTSTLSYFLPNVDLCHSLYTNGLPGMELGTNSFDCAEFYKIIPKIKIARSLI
jgi:hypothetical protein